MNQSHLVDILIVHGKDSEIVKDLTDLLTSLSFKVSDVLGLPSDSLGQYDRVNVAIKKSGLNLILVSFDEDEASSRKARVNVYDELRLSIEKRPKETLVLREIKGKKRVEIPSNLDGKCVILEFERTKLHKSYPNLIREIRARIVPDNSNNLDGVLKKGNILNKFLDKMDSIWEEEFDVASDNIVKDDWETETELKLLLDKFFQKYWKVFDALIRKNVDIDGLKEVIDSSVDDSYELAAQAWENVCDGNLKAFEVRLSRKEKDKKFKADEVILHRDEAYQLFRTSKNSKVYSSGDKIDGFRKAVKLLKECLK